jgi:acyl-CoA dehydrogenase
MDMISDPETFALLRQSVERFVTERLIPIERTVAEEDVMPKDVIAEMRDPVSDLVSGINRRTDICA